MRPLLPGNRERQRAESVEDGRRRRRGDPRAHVELERGAELAVPKSELPPPEEGTYYEFQLVGLEAQEEGGRDLGRVAAVQPGVANDVLELDSGLLLPLVEACVRKVDLGAGRIWIAPGFAPPS